MKKTLFFLIVDYGTLNYESFGGPFPYFMKFGKVRRERSYSPIFK
jgi:hypothetical protein